jgi:hypothetical protein
LVNYNSIFLQRIGQVDSISPWDDTKIVGFLNNAAFLVSRSYATPWASFEDIPDRYKYPVTLYAAIEFWWSKAGEYASKFDMQVGGNTNQKSSQLFDRALEMINGLKLELETVAKDMLDDNSPGDILVGDLIKRSKFTGYLIPRRDDPSGDWLS